MIKTIYKRYANTTQQFQLISSLVVISIPSVAMADISLTQLDVQDMLENLSKILNPAMALLLSISYIMGLFFIVKGLLLLKAFSAPLTQATRPGEIGGPLVYICVGAIMVYIPTSTDVLSTTLFGTVNSIFPGASGNSPFVPKLENMGSAADQIMGYDAGALIESQWATMIDTIVLYMQFIGFLAFLRGWLLIAHAGQPGVQPGSISKGIIHIVGGILAINFLPLVDVIHNTLVGSS